MRPAFFALLLAGFATPGLGDDRLQQIEQLEQQSGGRLGVILLDPNGETLLSYRGQERFAFCSAFKLALAGAALDMAEDGSLDLSQSIAFVRADFPGYQPVMEAKLVGERGTATLHEAIDAVMLVSDNLAANMLIDAMGGPSAVTQRWRLWGDAVSRLDRRETALNSNVTGDPRDTSSPLAMANVARMLYESDTLTRDHADRLARLAHNSKTGRDRVRAGLPDGWSAGDKTGTCAPPGAPNGQYNDIGWFRAGQDGPLHWFAVMLDRPKGTPEQAKEIHAKIGMLLASAAKD